MNPKLRSSGYVVLRNAIPPAMIAALKQHFITSVQARSSTFLEIPNPADVLNQEVKEEDPVMASLRKKFEYHQEIKRRRMLARRIQRRREKAKEALLRLREEKKKNSNNISSKMTNSENNDELQTQKEKSSSLSMKKKKKIMKFLKQVEKEEELLENNQKKKQQHQHEQEKKKKEKKKKENASEASASDLAALSKKIAEKLSTLNPAESKIENDPQRLQAINLHHCNAWMTNVELSKMVHGDFGKKLGSISQTVAGIEDPILFSDRPIFQLPFGRPTLMHFAAPFLGIESVDSCCSNNNNNNKLNAISIWIPLTLNNTVRVIEKSHNIVSERMKQEPKKLDRRLFRLDFPAVDSCISLWMRRFPEFSSSSSSSSSTSSGTTIEEAIELSPEDDLKPGNVIVMDPFTFAGVAPNITMENQVLVEFLIVSSENSKPSVHPYSWIRDWKSSSMFVDFSNSIVFPKLL